VFFNLNDDFFSFVKLTSTIEKPIIESNSLMNAEQLNEKEGQQPAQQAATDSLQPGVTSSPPVPKRLHVSNIPFRFRDPDLRAMFGVSSYFLIFLFLLLLLLICLLSTVLNRN